MCNKPVIPNGSVSPISPFNANTVGYGATYEVTCESGFVMLNTESSIMTCGAAGIFNQTPTCGKKTFIAEKITPKIFSTST